MRYTITSDGPKGRAFSAELLASIECEAVASWSGAKTTRPIFAVWAGTDAEMRPFVANLRCGRTAVGHVGNTEIRVEFLRSAEWRWSTQRTAAGATLTVWLPGAFAFDPGLVDKTWISFAMLVPASRVEEPSESDRARAIQHIESVETPDAIWRITELDAETTVRLAPVFCAYLDRRTRCPLIPDLAFQAQLLTACIRAENALVNEPDRYQRNTRYKEEGVTELGYARGIAFRCTHLDFEALLAREVARYYEVRSARKAA